MSFLSKIFKWSKYEVFISYCHEDGEILSPIIQLIRAVRNDLVFQDTHDLRPGKLWEPQILNALDQAEIVIVFWCEHSAKSEYVKKEYQRAITKKKDILPLMLDDTDVVKELLKYQWVDLRSTQIHSIIIREKANIVIREAERILQEYRNRLTDIERKLYKLNSACQSNNRSIIEGALSEFTDTLEHANLSDRSIIVDTPGIGGEMLAFEAPNKIVQDISSLIITELNKKLPPS